MNIKKKWLEFQKGGADNGLTCHVRLAGSTGGHDDLLFEFMHAKAGAIGACRLRFSDLL